ncbi:MAG: amidase family protein [Polyangiaceae bacterium]
MARTTADLSLMMRALDPVRASQLDPRTPPLPFVEPSSISLKGLRVGLFTDDGWVPPSRAVVRAVERASKALQTQGCEVVAFAPPDTLEAITLYFAAMAADGGRTIAPLLEGGAVDLVLEGLRKLASIPPSVRSVASKLANLAGEERVARLLRVTHEKNVAELWAVTARIREYRARMLDALDAAKIDALICPAHANPALPHEKSRDYAMAGSMSMLFNLVQFPAGVVPVTTVRNDEASRLSRRDRLEKLAADVDAQSAGLPVGVQVVGRPWAESTVLALMGAIESEVQNDEGFPRTPIPAIRATAEA